MDLVLHHPAWAEATAIWAAFFDINVHGVILPMKIALPGGSPAATGPCRMPTGPPRFPDAAWRASLATVEVQAVTTEIWLIEWDAARSAIMWVICHPAARVAKSYAAECRTSDLRRRCSYSIEDLQWSADRLHEWDAAGTDVIVYFDSDGHGKAARNARALRC